MGFHLFNSIVFYLLCAQRITETGNQSFVPVQHHVTCSTPILSGYIAQQRALTVSQLHSAVGFPSRCLGHKCDSQQCPIKGGLFRPGHSWSPVPAERQPNSKIPPAHTELAEKCAISRRFSVPVREYCVSFAILKSWNLHFRFFYFIFFAWRICHVYS